MITEAKKGIEKAVAHLDTEFSKIQMGRANPSLVEDMMVDQYGAFQALKNISSISNLDSQTLSIKPWDTTILHTIAKAINDANIGLNPQTMADSIIIKVPALTEERRKEVTKIAKKYAEEAKVSVRNVRGDTHKAIKKEEDDKIISEDQSKDLQNDLQKIVDEANKKIEEKCKKKETDIMKV